MLWSSLSLPEIIFVLYIILALLTAFPFFHEEKSLNRRGLWFNTIANSLLWPAFWSKFVYNVWYIYNHPNEEF